MVILGILLAISAANYKQARLRGAEASAIGSIAAINQAQSAYMHTCGNQRFAPTLQALGKRNPGTNAPFLSPDLTGAEEVVKSGYKILMEGTEGEEPLQTLQTCTGDTPVEGYHVTADPLKPGITGNRYFGSNASLVIYESTESLAGKMPDTGPPQQAQEVRGTPR